MATPPYSSSPSGGGTSLLADFHSLVQQVQNLLEEAAEVDEAQHRQLVHYDLRQCLRKLQNILHDDSGDLAARLLVGEEEDEVNDDGIHRGEDDNDDDCRRRELWGFTDDLIQLATLDHVSEDPSVMQLWKSLVPWAAAAVPTALNTDQLWRILARVLSILEEWNSILAGHVSTNTTSLTTNDSSTSGQWHWPPSDLDVAALQGLLDQLITSLEIDPSQLQEIVPALEADVVLVRPLQTVCWLTSLSRLNVGTTSFAPNNSNDDGHDQDQHGLPPEMTLSLCLLIDFLLGNLKAIVVERDAAAGGSTLSLRDWLHHKINQQHTADPTSMSYSADHSTKVSILPATDEVVLLKYLDQYAMELADEAIRLLQAETKACMGSTPNEKELDPNDHHDQEKRNIIFKALQYTSMATNFFFHTENDGFHESPKLQGLSRSLWHAFGDFVLNGMDCQVSFMDYELAATETLFRLTKTQLSPPANNRTQVNDHSDEKELTIVVTTVLRLLDGAEWFDKDDFVEWMETLLRDPIYGHKLVMPLQAALLSTLYLPDNRDAQDHEWMVSSLIKWTGLRDVDMISETTTNDDPSETVNGVWKGYVADQMHRKQG